jgi:predicted Co/Zn/Cd cation transporter (cation efflux family)
MFTMTHLKSVVSTHLSNEHVQQNHHSADIVRPVRVMMSVKFFTYASNIASCTKSQFMTTCAFVHPLTHGLKYMLLLKLCLYHLYTTLWRYKICNTGIRQYKNNIYEMCSQILRAMIPDT